MSNFVKNTPLRVVFSTLFSVFGYSDETLSLVFDILHQTREKYDAQRSIFDEIRGVWITDKTLSRVFDISSQSRQKLRCKRTSKIVKIYAY